MLKGKRGFRKRRPPRTILDSSVMCKSATASSDFILYIICMDIYIFSGVAVFLHWLCFGIILIYRRLQDFKMYGIVECRLPTRPVAVWSDLEPLQNLLGSALAHATPFHQISWKSVWWVLCSHAWRQTEKQTHKPTSKPRWKKSPFLMEVIKKQFNNLIGRAAFQEFRYFIQRHWDMSLRGPLFSSGSSI